MNQLNRSASKPMIVKETSRECSAYAKYPGLLIQISWHCRTIPKKGDCLTSRLQKHFVKSFASIADKFN